MRQGKHEKRQGRALAHAGAVTFLIAAIGAMGAPTYGQNRVPLRSAALDVVEGQVATAFPDISHMSPERLAVLLREDRDRIALLDVRDAEEFAVSRLEGAHRVDPTARRTADILAAAGSLEGKVVVVYCSVGLRSSRLLVRIGQSLRETGATELHNLSGGAFRWRNEGRPLENSAGPTRAVHPHNPLWRQFLLDDPGMIIATK